MINIVGLGPGNPGLLTSEAVNLMLTCDHLILRTSQHPAVTRIMELGISFSTCDEFYEQFDDFDSVYNAITKHVVAEARNKNVVYAVPGSPMVAERTVVALRELAKSEKIAVRVFSAVSFLDELFARLDIDPLENGVTIIDASAISQLPPTINTPLVITQVYDARVLSDTKLSLAELYGDEYQVIYAANLGLPDEIIERVSLKTNHTHGLGR